MHPTKLGRIWLAEIFRAEEMGCGLGGGNEHREWNLSGGNGNGNGTSEEEKG
jgi:hypothetical protein